MTENKKILVCLLHGFLGAPSDFENLVQLMKKHEESDQLEFFIPDLLEDNVPYKSDFTFREWAQKFNDFIVDLGDFKEKILIGYSLGGRLALHARLESQNLWDKVFLLSTNPGLLTLNEKEERKKFDLDCKEKLENCSKKKFINDWNQLKVFENDSPINLELYNDLQFKKYQKKASDIFLNWSLAHHKIDVTQLKQIKLNTYWIFGENDEKFINLSKDLKEKEFIQLRYVVKNAGHRLISEENLKSLYNLITNLNLL